MSDDWIEHDGTCCPVPVGVWVETLRKGGKKVLGPSTFAEGEMIKRGFGNPWLWKILRLERDPAAIIAYRIPRSRAAEDFIERIRNMEPQGELA